MTLSRVHDYSGRGHLDQLPWKASSLRGGDDLATKTSKSHVATKSVSTTSGPSKIAAIYSVSAGTKPETLTVSELGTAPVTGSYSSLTPVTIKGATYLLGFNPASATLDIYAVSAKKPYLTSVAAKPTVGKARDILNVFDLGGVPYLVMYTAKSGVFEVYAIADDFSLSAKPYKFFRNHELAVSQGFTTLKPFLCQGQVAFLGYNNVNGYVALYTASIIPESAGDDTKPPIQMLPVWAHAWAKGWNRFALFQFGGCTFFLKTNTWKPNVNIDHVLDVLANGTVEVGALVGAEGTTGQLQSLTDAQSLTNCEPFVFGPGDPYFVTYISKSGAMTLNRFHGDCLGWTTEASLTAQTGGTAVTPVAVSAESLFLIVA